MKSMITMKVEILINKSVDENAALYYEKAKKAKGKLEGIKKAISHSEQMVAEHNIKIEKDLESSNSYKSTETKKRKLDWYEKFRWFFTSEGKLVIGGRDATSNENVIKKHTEKGDLVFHTDMAGSPFMVIKSEGREISDIEKEETAEFLACYSRAWKAGISSIEVFYVNPDQVTKEANSGEYLQKGSFMIRGKTTYIHAYLRLAISVIDGRVYSGPISAIKTYLSNFYPDLKKHELEKKFFKIVQGTSKSSQVAKEIKKKFGGDLDEIIKALPPGGCRISK